MMSYGEFFFVPHKIQKRKVGSVSVYKRIKYGLNVRPNFDPLFGLNGYILFT